jgi:acetyltransferase-like isoleucine patch superfamily enzyme
MLKKIKKHLKYFNLKTLLFNLKYFTFQDAIKFPVFVNRHTYIRNLKGKIIIYSKIKTGMIKFGADGVSIFDNKKSRSIWDINGTIIFQGHANIGHGSKVHVNKNAILTIGENFVITAESSIVCQKGITIGNNCLFSWDILIIDSDQHPYFDSNNNILNLPEAIAIGNNVWIGCRSVLLKGTIIPNGSIIGAGSLVNKRFTLEHCIIAGVPANIVKKNIFWSKKNFI